MRTALLSLALLLLVPAVAQAQIVNVQSLIGKPVTEGASGNVAAALEWQSGNTDLVAASGATTGFYRRGNWLSFLTVSGAYGRKGQLGHFDPIPYQEKIFEHLRLRRQLTDAWSWEAFTQHEFDRWRRLRFRALLGMGARLDVEAGQSLRFAFGLAYMAQWEELLKPAAGDPVGTILEHRLSSYVTGGWQLSETAALALTVYVQPNLRDAQDVRGLVDASLAVAITKALQLKLIHTLGYDTTPPQHVRGYDASTKFAIAAQF
jgi:putative salt-induced outer membrane protein YdiY